MDAHALLTARGAVSGRHLQQAIGVDVEGHLHLGDPAGSGRNTGEAEAPETFIALGHLSLPLQHMDLHRALV